MPAHPDSVAPLRHAVVDFARRCGASATQRDDIALAVSEAVSNVVLHAYDGCESPGMVTVVASVHAQALEVVVCDEGAGMHARPDSPGLGAGLTIIRLVTEQLEIESLAPGVKLRMTFAIC